MANHVGHVDWSFTANPLPASWTSEGLARRVLVGPDQGAVHTELAAGAFAPGGWLRRHIHSFEEGLYVLSGELVLDIGGAVHRLVAGDFGLIPIGTWHALANGGDGEVRWLSVNTPQRLAADAGRRDTFFTKDPFDAAELVNHAVRPRFGDPATSVCRPLRWDAAAGRGTPRQRPGPGTQAGRHGHRAAGLQRHLGEDADRPDLRIGPADDVHGRLRDRRRRAGRTTTRSRRRTSSWRGRSSSSSTASSTR